MYRYLLKIVLILFSINLFAQSKIVIHAEIEGDIDLGLAPFVKRVISEAEEKNAEAIIFEINTFGGRVAAATQIKDAILESKIPTIAFVNKRAISAGALITLSCRKIAMAPGSSIGATTVVDQTGQKQAEKYQSYMRSEMRSTAERNGRRTDIAEAMVDERVVIKGLVDSTQLVTLTAEEAHSFQIADTVVNDIKSVLKAFDLEGAKIQYTASNWAEKVVRFLNNPIISSLLIMIGLIGLYTEIKTPGWGLPGSVGVIALILFFGSSYILDLASIVEILLFLIGVILLIAEIFVIPGFGIAGIGGIILIFVSLFLSLINTNFYIDYSDIMMAIIQLGGAVFGSVIVISLLLKYLPQTKAFGRLILSDETSTRQGFISNPDYNNLVETEGEAITAMRPAGIALINGKRFDVVTEGDFIEKGSKIKVDRVEGVRIIIKKNE
jgi:membrane-bound serine protease (ClpP class)